MVTLLRKYQKSIMVVVTGAAILGLISWGSKTPAGFGSGTDQAYRVYGRDYSQADVERKARRYQLAMGVGLNEFVRGLSGQTNDQNQMIDNFLWNSYVLDHEAKELGIEPTDAEVLAAMKKLPAFLTNKEFDPAKYEEFVEKRLGPRGFSESELENLVRDDLRLKKIAELVGTTVEVTPAEFRTAYVRIHEKMEVSLIPFKLADFSATVQPSDAEIKKYYDDHKSAYVTPEKRIVNYVKIDLTEAEKQLKGKDKERIDALQRVADRANDFTQAMLEKGADFTEVAKKLGVAVETTQEFSEAEPSPEFANAAPVAAAAFKLTTREPNSDAVQAETGFYILHLNKIAASHPLSMDEARPQTIAQLKNEKGHDALVSKANEVRAKISASMKSGKSFADAVKELGLKTESFPPFEMAERLDDKPNGAEISDKAVELANGDLSDLIATQDGGLLVHMDGRKPIDEAKFEKDKEQIEMLRKGKRYAAFANWLQLRRKEANPQSLLEPARRG